MSEFSRRRFLGAAAGIAGSLATTRGALSQDASPNVDVAIVGGGISGLFCAMRLKNAGFDVALFEASDRLGGRVMSVLLPGFSDQAAELGAMRLRKTDAIEMKLIETLLGAEARVPFDYPTLAWFLRDRLLRDLGDAAAIPYGLDSAEQGIVSSGKNLLSETIDQIAKRNQGPEANDRGFWEQVIRIRSKEGRNFIVDSLGYDSLTTNWNLGAAVPWFLHDFAPGTAYWKIQGGLQRLPDAVATAYVESGGLVHTRHTLRRIRRGDKTGMNLTFGTPEGLREVTADRVILALPLAAIERLDPDSFILRDDQFRAALSTVKRHSLVKIHMSFSQPWWHAAGFGRGRVVTDLPLRQTYFWGQSAASGKGLAMASYHDGVETGFWDQLDIGEAYGPVGWIDDARGADGLPLPASMAESIPIARPMAEEVWYQLKRVHSLPESAPPPLLGTYRNWGEDPLYGAGYHLWKVGADVDATMSFMREPSPGLHVCGEAWSDHQGWISGATTTADRVLREKFNLPPYLSS